MLQLLLAGVAVFTTLPQKILLLFMYTIRSANSYVEVLMNLFHPDINPTQGSQ